MRLIVESGVEAAAQRAAATIAAAAAEAIAARRQFTLALSGGRTPERMLVRLARAAIDWTRVRLYQVDERIAPPGDPARNLTQLTACLLDRLDARPAFEAMPVDEGDLQAAARRYGETLPPRFDLIHLGLGADGHTASLVPGDPVLDARDRVGITTPYQGHRRMTLTYPVLDAARQVLYLVTGADKRHALERLLASDPGIPAGRVAGASVLVVADRAAAQQDPDAPARRKPSGPA